MNELPSRPMPKTAQETQPRSDAIVWDNHVCLPMDPASNLEALSSIESFRRHGVNVVSINAGFGTLPWASHLALLMQMRGWFAAQPDRYILARTADDILAARDTGRMAIIFDVEGAMAVEDDLSRVQRLYDLGVRWLLIAYNRSNAIGGGCHDDDDTGLTPHGRALVREMERVGMVVCCSHTGWKTARDVLDFAETPVIFSHSNARAVHDHPRNIDDDLIRRCAATGGLVGVNGINIFLGPDAPSIDQMVRHIDHIVSVAGIDHVAVGLDWAPPANLAGEIEDMAHLFPPGHGYERIRTLGPEAFPRLADALLERAFHYDDIAKVLGLNLLRVAQQSWKA